MPKYNLVLCNSDEDEITALARLSELEIPLTEVELPIEKDKLFGDRVLFDYKGQNYTKFAQVQSTPGAWLNNCFPTFMLFARPAKDVLTEIVFARRDESGLVVVRNDEVQRLV